MFIVQVCATVYKSDPSAWARSFVAHKTYSTREQAAAAMQLAAKDRPDCVYRVTEVPGPAATDVVTKPAHYTSGGIEVLDAIEAWGLDKNMRLANVVKYVARAGKKDPAKELEDLKKAQFYLNREIARREGK